MGLGDYHSYSPHPLAPSPRRRGGKGGRGVKGVRSNQPITKNLTAETTMRYDILV